MHGVSPWVGTGAGAYATVRNRFRTGTLFVRHAHGYVPQTLADLGWAGLALSLLALGLWGGAAARVLGLRPRDRGLPWDAERVGMATLVAVALVFGVHSPSTGRGSCRPTRWCGLLAAAGWSRGRRCASGSEAAALGARRPRRGRARRGRPRRRCGRRRAEAAPAVADVAGPGRAPGRRAEWRRRPPFPWRPAAAAVAGPGARARPPPGRPSSPCARSTPATSRSSGCETRRARRRRRRSPRSRTTATRSRPSRCGSCAYIEEQRGRLANAQSARSRRRCGSSPRAPRPGAGSAASSSRRSTSPPTRSRRSARPTSSTRATRRRRRTSSRRAARRAARHAAAG